MPRNVSSRVRIAGAALALFACGAASAELLTIESDSSASTENLGSFSGALHWQFNGGPTGTLTISLTNTNDATMGGYITAFAFNVDAVSPTASLVSTTNGSFGEISNINGMPFGMNFLAGASTGGSFQGGGNPSGGIGVGDTATFVYSIAASDLGALSASSFLGGPYEYNFIVRFRGFNDGGSDKVPAIVTSAPVPAPAAIALLGVAGLLGGRRRRD